MRAWTAVLVLALAAGTGLRLFRLGHSFRVDELEAWAQSQKPTPQILAEEGRLPHVSLLSRYASEFLGDGEARFRLPYALYGILSLPLIFLLGRRLFDERVGAVACLLLALSPYHIQYSQEARYYAPLTFYALSALYCLLCAFDPRTSRNRAWYWGGFLLSQVLALYLHRFALYPLVLSAATIALLSLERAPRSRGLPLAAAALLACAGVLARQWSELRRFLFLENVPRWSLPLRESYLRWHYRPPDSSIAWDLISTFSGGEALGAMLLALAVAGLAFAGRERLRRSSLLWLWAALPVASLFVVRSRTHFELRYFIFILPIWFALAAAGAVAVADALASRAALALLVAAALLLDGRSLFSYYALPKARMRETFEHIASQSRPGDAVVFYPPWDVLWYGYYGLPAGRKLYEPALFAEESPSFSAAAAAREHRRLWLAATWVADPVRERELGSLQGSIGHYYAAVSSTAFHSRDRNDDYQVWLYERRAAGPRAPAKAGWPEAEIPRDTFLNRKICLALNIPEAAAMMAAARMGFFEALDNTALVRDPGGEKKTARQVSRFCAKGCVVLAWSGSGRLGGAAGIAFEPGDVFYSPSGAAVTSLSRSSPEVVLLLETARSAPSGSAKFQRLARLRSAAPDAGSVKIPVESADVWSRRLRGDGIETEGLGRGLPWRLVTGVVLDGLVHIEDAAKTHILDFRKGDVYLYGSVWPERWSSRSSGPETSLELRFAEDRGRSPVDVALSSTTGKTGSLWPPLLLQ